MPEQPQGRFRLIRWLFGGLVAVFLVLQLLPFGRPRTNPPVTAEPAWDSPRTRVLFFRSCADCHSNETRWPWYSRVAPVSWLVTKDVREGREHFNISEWNSPQDDAQEAAEMVQEGEMPPWFYLPTHPEAWYTDAERADLIAGLTATFGSEDGERGRNRRRKGGDGERDED